MISDEKVNSQGCNDLVEYDASDQGVGFAQLVTVWIGSGIQCTSEAMYLFD